MGEATRIEVLVAGLRCSGEAPVLSRKLERIRGVVQAYANPVTEIAYIDILPDDFSLEEAVHLKEPARRRHADAHGPRA